jgi:tRNA threonylcarbamoyladenosine biosynthesis protein TsaB
MLVLTIETSTPTECVAVVRDGAVLAEKIDSVGRAHTEMLLGAIDEVLNRAELRLCDLGAIVVSSGPGRFSGLRVGLATAKGLSSVSAVPVIPVGTLPALAASGPATEGLVAPLLDARRGEVYGALFRLGKDAERLLPDAAGSPAEMLRRILSAGRKEHIYLTGSGAPLCAAELDGLGADASAITLLPTRAPTARGLAALASRAEPVGQEELGTLEPVYLRGV